jgi:hypothetical protein
MIDAITEQLIELNYLNVSVKGKRGISLLKSLEDEKVTEYGEKLCEKREYPTDLARRNVSGR